MVKVGDEGVIKKGGYWSSSAGLDVRITDVDRLGRYGDFVFTDCEGNATSRSYRILLEEIDFGESVTVEIPATREDPHTALSEYVRCAIEFAKAEKQWDEVGKALAATMHNDEFPAAVLYEGQLYVVKSPTDTPEKVHYITE